MKKIDEKEIKKIEELDKLARPLQQYIKKNHNPHTYIVIADNSVRVVSDEIYIPSKEDESENLEFEEMMKDVLRFVRDDIDKMLGDDKDE